MAPQASKESTASAGTYRAVTIGVKDFAEPYPALTYATGLTDDLRAELASLGYHVIPAPTPDASAARTSQQIGDEVVGAITAASPDDVLIVHVLTHGEVNDGNRALYVLGTDGKPHPQADIEGWLKLLHDKEPRPLVLFLLDICQSGTAARLNWLGNTADGSGRAWVIAACAPDERAFNGWLTQATTSVLRSLRARELDISPTVEYVPLRTVGRAIRKEVARLASAGQGLTQQVTGTQLDFLTDPPDLPFFKNPAFTRHPTAVRVEGKEPALTPFADNIDEPASWGGDPDWVGDPDRGGAPDLNADPGLGARHFADRARGHGNIAAPQDAGCFTGRVAELSNLVQWLKYPRWAQADSPRTLSVVTGGPGVGKSAILGVIVCAAHPDLRDETAPLWSRARHTPDEMPHLVAVHARQLDLADVTASLARQLAKAIARSDIPADPQGLVKALTTAAGQAPVIVLDALDEAVGAQAIVSDLIFPLISARRPDGTPACRLLIGTRRDGFEPLLDAARAQHGLIDLDETDRDTLLGDLNSYVVKLLRTQPAYRDRALAGARGAFAEEVAATLAQPDGDRRWGEFLIAGLYTHSFLRTTADSAISDRNLAGEHGTACPRTLPEVLELDLATRPNGSELRQVLQIVSLARGNGMPATIIDRCRATATPPNPTRQILADLGFYLRRANDEDGITLYRIFHEGLAEELRPPAENSNVGFVRDDDDVIDVAPHARRTIPLQGEALRRFKHAWAPGSSRRRAEAAIIDAMLRDLGPEGVRRWDLAEPYVLRHFVEHARAAGVQEPGLAEILLDPEFLVHADASVSGALESWREPIARKVRWILRNAQSIRLDVPAAVAAQPTHRRSALALAAARNSAPVLAAALCRPPAGSPEPPLLWCPRWTEGVHLPKTMMNLYWPKLLVNFELPIDIGAAVISALAVGVVGDELTVFTATVGGSIHWRPLVSGRLVAVSANPTGRFHWIDLPDRAMAKALGVAPDGTLISADGKGKLIKTDSSGRHVVSKGSTAGLPVVAISAVRLSGRLLAALTSADGSIHFVDLATGRAFDHIPAEEAVTLLTLGEKEYRLRRTGSTVEVRIIREYDGGELVLGSVGILAGHADDISTLTTMTLDGRPVAVTASFDGTVRFWDVPACREIERLTLPGPVQAVVPAGDNHLAVLCCGEAIIYARTAPREGSTPP